MIRKITVNIAIAIIAIVGVVFILTRIGRQSLPDFRDMEDVNERKEAFFDFLLPHVREANREILKKRQHLRVIAKRSKYHALNKRDLRWLQQEAEAHSIEVGDLRNELNPTILELDLRMDVIPPSMALAQAALESGWGSSRFARKANNLFGIRCFSPGCGIVPEQRPAGATYEVKKYPSPADCFLHYMEILNGNPAYRQLWSLRQNARINGDPLSGAVLAGGLQRYSTQGGAYIEKVRRMIESNQLDRFDTF